MKLSLIDFKVEGRMVLGLKIMSSTIEVIAVIIECFLLVVRVMLSSGSEKESPLWELRRIHLKVLQ